MVVPITFTEGGRNKLGIVTAILCALLSFAGICVIGVGAYIKYRINDELILLESYDSDVLPLFLVSVGTLMLVINGASIKIIYDCGFAETSEKFRIVLLPLTVFMFLFVWVILAAGIMTLASRSNVEEALHGGLKDAMIRYKNNISVKITIDRVQMRSRCCGSVSYKDWFNVGWINTDYVNKFDPQISSKMVKGDLFVENVPFSCCDVSIVRPCVMHDVMDKSKHTRYDSVTLYKSGCTGVLMDEYESSILHPTGSTIMVLFGVQFAVIILLRYLQTSIQNAYEEGDPEGPGKGSLIPGQLCDSCATGNPAKYQDLALERIKGVKKEPEPEPDYDMIDDSSLGGMVHSPSPGYMPDMEATRDLRAIGEGQVLGSDVGGMSRGGTTSEKHQHQKQASSKSPTMEKSSKKSKFMDKIKSKKGNKESKKEKSKEEKSSKKDKSSKKEKSSKKDKSSKKSKSRSSSRSPSRISKSSKSPSRKSKSSKSPSRKSKSSKSPSRKSKSSRSPSRKSRSSKKKW